MKNKALFFLPVLCLFLSSCFELEETYNLKADGSYTANYEVNMGAVLGLLTTMAPDSVKDKPDYKTGKDSTFNMATKMPDSLKKTLNAEELKLLNNTDMRVQMKMSEGIFKIGFANNGGSLNELNYFVRNFGKLMKKGKVDNLIGNSLGGGNTSANASDNEDGPFGNDEFSYVINGSTFERKIKADIVAEKRKKNEQVYKMIEGMNMKMTNTTIINLPKTAKSVEGAKAILSADKKQVKLVVNMLEALKTPEILNFKVNY